MDTETIERPVTRSTKAISIDARLAELVSEGRRLEDRQLWMMAKAFAPTGGMPRIEDLARLMRRHHDRPVTAVAQWIAARDVISVAYGPQTRLPLFQFDPVSMAPQPQVLTVLDELRAVFDDWEVAVWFTTPNGWLAHRMPVEVSLYNWCAVLDAARADRYIALG